MQDPYEGQGGSYTLDPKTGKRTRVEEPTTHPSEDASLLDTGSQPALSSVSEVVVDPKQITQGE